MLIRYHFELRLGFDFRSGHRVWILAFGLGFWACASGPFCGEWMMSSRSECGNDFMFSTISTYESDYNVLLATEWCCISCGVISPCSICDCLYLEQQCSKSDQASLFTNHVREILKSHLFLTE